jgi:hypothetical protein
MENQTQIPVNQSVSETVIQEEQQPKKSNFLVILLSILLFISVAIAGFFAFQNQKLNEELKMKNEEIKKTSQKISEPAKQQTSISTIPEFTSKWKVYTNSKLGISIKVPEFVEIIEDIKPDGSFSIRSWEPQFIEINIGIEKKSVPDLIKYYDGQLQKQGTIILGSLLSDVYVGYGGEGGSYLNKAVWIQKNDKVYQMYSGTLFNDSSAEKIVDQILSTFKFTN